VAASPAEALTRGRLEANIRTRSESAEQDNLTRSHLLSVRPRLGFTTATYLGLQAMLEGEAIVALSDDDRYNAAGSNDQPGRTVIADPEVAEVNQAWLGYARGNSRIRGGRQALVYDNSRWIGDVIWRQNQQSYDAILVETRAIDDTVLGYAYIDAARRIYGDVDGLPPANRNFESRSHLLHAEYAGFNAARMVAYAYLLDLGVPGESATGNNSSATYGAFLQGSLARRETPGQRVNYRAELAWQRDYGRSMLDYGAPYYSVEVTADVGRYTLGGGYEVLGADSGSAVRAPLSTLHAFNGWADVFLTTPADGLSDLYAIAAVQLPGAVPLRFIYHRFRAEDGSAQYGHEVNVVAHHRIARSFTVLAKYARYSAGDAFRSAASTTATIPAFDKEVLWAQVEFAY
jgi:hypothetical protein